MRGRSKCEQPKVLWRSRRRGAASAIVEQDTATLQQSGRWPQNLTQDWLEPDRGKRDVNPQQLEGGRGILLQQPLATTL